MRTLFDDIRSDDEPYLEREELAPIADEEPEALSVRDYVTELNSTLYDARAIIAGEVAECRMHPTGLYFTIKDPEYEDVLNCYVAPKFPHLLKLPLQTGVAVRIWGYPRVRPKKGSLLFEVQGIALIGEGALKKAYDDLKRQLEQEGLFERVRPLPSYVRRIGVITSRTGAVIDDFRKNLLKVGYAVHLYDARVEGAQAVPSLLEALSWFREHAADYDALVIIRGGGSLEDLQAFNSEAVIRAIFASPVPTLCGIGHDRDVPLASLVADYAYSTPSIVATKLNEPWSKLRERVPTLEARLVAHGDRTVAYVHRIIDRSAASLVGAVSSLIKKPDEYARRIVEKFEQSLRAATEQTLAYERFLGIVNPERTLRLGYSIVRTKDGTVVKSVEQVAKGSPLSVQVADGTIESTVDTVKQ